MSHDTFSRNTRNQLKPAFEGPARTHDAARAAPSGLLGSSRPYGRPLQDLDSLLLSEQPRPRPKSFKTKAVVPRHFQGCSAIAIVTARGHGQACRKTQNLTLCP